jgi:hypothetical protein
MPRLTDRATTTIPVEYSPVFMRIDLNQLRSWGFPVAPGKGEVLHWQPS